MKVHYLQHVPYEGLGYIETWLQEKNYNITSTLFFEANYLLPEVENIDALIVLGGPMNVYDDDQYHWLTKEKEFISKCIKSDIKILGICLGAQLIANCLGYPICKATFKEIGWFPILPTQDCVKLPWFHELFKDLPYVFHWHGDQFKISNGKTLNLLISEANGNQAFSYSPNILGLQFHLEVTKFTINEMLQYGNTELITDRFVQSFEEIATGMFHIKKCNVIMGKILQRWLAY